MRPKSKGSSTMGVKKSVVATRACWSLRRYTAASSAVSVHTSRSGGRRPAGTRRISSASTAGAILQPHPPPWENRVSLMASMERPRNRAGEDEKSAMKKGVATVAQLFDFDEIIDTRSPAEFAEDRVPGAINCPVLDDEQRARVGALYKKVSPFEARRLGGADR